MTPQPPINYRVSQSQIVTEQFRQLFARAERLGWRRIFLVASHYMMDELAYDPIHFGESRGTLPHLQLEMRIAFAPPVYVEFAVHEPSRQVFIRNFGMRD
jgi:hypothetical protein